MRPHDLTLEQRYPRERLDKLGVEPSSIVAVLGIVEDPTFHDELSGRTRRFSIGRARKNATIIIYGVDALPDLDRLTKLRESIAQDGAIWVLWPKGRKELREDHIRRAAIAQGLVDVKVMSFSETLSGLKLVIPVAQREKTSRKKRPAGLKPDA
jgi:hypothetical protein